MGLGVTQGCIRSRASWPRADDFRIEPFGSTFPQPGNRARLLSTQTKAGEGKHLTMMAFWLAAILLVTYSIALILVGHGAAPLALLLVWGDPADMLPGQVLSWASIVGLVFVTIWFRHDPLKLAIWQLTASIFLYLSWFVFAYFGAGPSVLWNSLRVSAPFQVAFVVVAGILIGQIARRHRERRAASSSSSNAP
jgi:hypothetical protein